MLVTLFTFSVYSETPGNTSPIIGNPALKYKNFYPKYPEVTYYRDFAVYRSSDVFTW